MNYYPTFDDLIQSDPIDRGIELRKIDDDWFGLYLQDIDEDEQHEGDTL